MTERLAWVERINLGDDIHQSDVPVVGEMLARLFSRLASWPPAAVEMWLRVKDRDEPGMRMTLELQAPALPRLLATSREDSFAAAVHDVGDTMVRQLNEASARYAEHGSDTIRR